MATTHSIRNKTARAKLPPSGEPYWHKISKGRFVGFRKNKLGGTWVARYKSERKSIGDELHMDYAEALDRTMEYCDQLDSGVQIDYTIENAIKDYCDNIAENDSYKKAEKYRVRLTNLCTEEFIQTPVHELTTRQLTKWMHDKVIKISNDPTEEEIELQRKSKASVKRNFGQFHAMLNFSWRQEMVPSNNAWLRVKKFTTSVEKGRDIFFTDEQITKILNEAREPFRSYFKASVLIGARPGEWADPKVEDFDRANRTVYIGRKVKEKRHAVLNNKAYEFIVEQCKNKLPKALIFTNEKGEKWETDKLGHEFKRVIRAIRKSEEKSGVPEDKLIPEEAVPYCLRHYFISKGMECPNIQILLLARNCGTSVKQIEATYGKFRKTTSVEQLNQIQLAI